ncbi:MAG: hypothetical protein ACLT4F_09265 [Clostridia bacterium]
MPLDNTNILHKIKSEDLIFSDDIEDDRTNTYLTLNDYDWMNYKLSTRFRTKDMVLLNIEFEYFGAITCFMNVTQQIDTKVKEFRYEYSVDIFKKHFIDFLKKHIASWDSQYAFNGEEEVIDFYNDVLEHGTVSEIGNHIIN